jgi:hypothetical protein
MNSRDDYPVPAASELQTEPASSGWFFDGKAWRHILAACDLRDRVVMLDDKADGTGGGAMWIWSRPNGTSNQFKVDEAERHTGHWTSTAKTAPREDRVVDFTPDATMFHGRVGRTYSAMVDCRAGDHEAVEYLVACSTSQHFAEIDALLPPACSTFPGGIGWPLSLTLVDTSDARATTPGSLATVSADRTTWTYRFGSGDDRVELVLHVGPTHGGELRLPKQKPESCVMIFSDHRRAPAP